jgi:HPt (histidine-containing phosphotransfer) domain-containing protein
MNFIELAEKLELDIDEYLDLIFIFIEKGKSDIEEIMSALEEKDLDKMAKAAHSLRGAAINLGLDDIHEAARYIENMTSEKDLEGVPESLQALIRGMQQIIALAEK